jgi:acetyl-CoA synthetase
MEGRKMQKFPPPEEFRKKAYIRSSEEFSALYSESLSDPEGFWSRMAEELVWFKKWDKVHEDDFARGETRWFTGGRLNAAYNCLSRHIDAGRAEKTAIIWEAEDGEVRTFTYRSLDVESCRVANLFKKLGVKKGDRVAFYLPMIPELVIGMLACARIGAVHSVVFGGFSAASLMDRLNNSGATLLVTSDGSYRAGRVIPLKKNADEILPECPTVKNCLVVRRTGERVHMELGRDLYIEDTILEYNIPSHCDPEPMEAEDPLFILYTSGSTGKPKGLLHTTGGFMVFANCTFKYIFDYHEEDIFWCTADIGWITGHTYIVYGPLSFGATSLMFEGVPTWPAPDRFWKVVEKHKVNTFYTAPTVIRSLAREGEEWTQKADLSSLQLLGTVGEPINPEAWLWYHKNVGKGRCPIVDTWWQTESGGILICSLPGAFPMKPGAAGKPFFGVEPVILKTDGKPAGTNEEGSLVLKRPWPGLARSIWGDPRRFEQIYFTQFKGYYFTGDGARVDEDGDYHLLGRVDDVINVSGHRLGTAEIESALVTHPKVAEAAVVGFPHEIKGQGIYAFVILKAGVEPSPGLLKELDEEVRNEIGPIARPDSIQFVEGLPKTRSGKIMRRILRKIVEGKPEEIGDVSTLAEPAVVEKIIEGKAEAAKK